MNHEIHVDCSFRPQQLRLSCLFVGLIERCFQFLDALFCVSKLSVLLVDDVLIRCRVELEQDISLLESPVWFGGYLHNPSGDRWQYGGDSKIDAGVRAVGMVVVHRQQQSR